MTLRRFFDLPFKNHLFSYFKNLFDSHKNPSNSTRAKTNNKTKSCGFMNLKLLDSIAKKLSPTIFKDLKALAKPNMVKIVDKSTMIPKDLILMARAPKIPIIGRANKILRPV